MIGNALLTQLNAGSERERLFALERAVQEASFPPADARLVNNHIHTTYSFSPYSPSAAVFAARNEGLSACGIVDHDSMGGAREFLKAAEIMGISATVGIEARVSFAETPLLSRRLNNPDQTGNGYLVLHAVPHENIERVQAFFAPVRELRGQRNRSMLERINALYAADGVDLDYERDVLPLSQAAGGGSVTERHLMLALARRLIALGKAKLPEGAGEWETMLAEYDLVGVLKKDCIPKVFVPAAEECPTLREFVRFSAEVGGILAYAYLGDVTNSVTGDKKAQKFEDDYLDELFEVIDRAGIRAVTYMPTRNTPEQISRLRALCERYGMLQISGEDINSPRQKFVIDQMLDERFSNLIESTWRLIRHENGEGE
ncbi:MAG TPA: PHP domain-containing protein [Candidatus Cryosericum sp.]|nr:PHP domain-containing protein [Candidatus Cryosericum sp.]